jgi:hypothetical protein
MSELQYLSNYLCDFECHIAELLTNHPTLSPPLPFLLVKPSFVADLGAGWHSWALHFVWPVEVGRTIFL